MSDITVADNLIAGDVTLHILQNKLSVLLPELFWSGHVLVFPMRCWGGMTHKGGLHYTMEACAFITNLVMGTSICRGAFMCPEFVFALMYIVNLNNLQGYYRPWYQFPKLFSFGFTSSRFDSFQLYSTCPLCLHSFTVRHYCITITAWVTHFWNQTTLTTCNVFDSLNRTSSLLSHDFTVHLFVKTKTNTSAAKSAKFSCRFFLSPRFKAISLSCHFKGGNLRQSGKNIEKKHYWASFQQQLSWFCLATLVTLSHHFKVGDPQQWGKTPKKEKCNCDSFH